MKRTLWCLVIGLLVGAGVQVSWAIDGPLTTASNLRVRTNENGYLLVASGAAGAIDGPLTNFGNIRLRTNENGYLMVTVAGGGSGAPTDATYITQTANGDLSAEQALSALSSGIMRVATTTGAVTSLTTSAGIFANISDETGGAGVLVGATNPTLAGWTSSTDGIFSTATAVLRLNTSDASDTGYLGLTGGGAFAIGDAFTRGARVVVFGNEAASSGGYVTVQLGNTAGALFRISGATGGGSTYFTVDGDTGAITMPALLTGAAGDEDICHNPTTYLLTSANASTCIVSSLRYKGGWTPLDGALAKVLRLETGSYYNLNDPTRKAQLGLNAENMAIVEPRLAFSEQSGPDIGKPRGVLYEQSVALLTKAIQELTACVKSPNPARCVAQLEAR